MWSSKMLQSVSVSSQACLQFSSPRRSRKLPTLATAGPNSTAKILPHRALNSYPNFYGTKNYPHNLVKRTKRLNQVSYDNLTKRFLVKADSNQQLEYCYSESSFSSKIIWESTKYHVDVFFRFSRQYTVIGTILGVTSMSLLAIESLSDFTPIFFMGMSKAMVVALCMNMYMTGFNQLTDIEIDKVNKPNLPLASGEYSYRTGALIVASCTITGLWLAWTTGSLPLISAAVITFLLGTGYSLPLPLLRWKNSGLLATLCIVFYRAFTVQIAYYLHIKTHVLQRPLIFPKPLIFVTAFVSLFAFVNSLLKDIPDLEGDKKFGVQSFTVRLGPKRVFWFCFSLLVMGYAAAICVGAMSLNPWNKAITVLGHGFLASILWNRAKAVDLKNNADTLGFYLFVWKLLYVEYFLFPLMR